MVLFHLHEFASNRREGLPSEEKVTFRTHVHLNNKLPKPANSCHKGSRLQRAGAIDVVP